MKHTQETKDKIRKALTGRKRPPFSKEWLHNFSLARKGIRFTEEHKKKISIALKGKKKKPVTLEHRIAISLGITKEKLFVGFKSKEGTLFRASKEYKQWRDFIFRRDDYTCFDCKIRGGYLEAHHRRPFSLFPEDRLRYVNGITLCKPCHSNTDTYMGRIKNYYKTHAR